MQFKFDGELWLHEGNAAWHFVTVPLSVSEEIADLTAHLRRGFGSVRVTAEIGSTVWNTSVFPDASTRTYVLPVKKQVRASEEIAEGDEVAVSIVVHGVE